MPDLRDLTTDAKRLYEAMDYLLEQQDKANTDDIDFKEIWFGAKSRPFEHHCIENLDVDEAKSYLLILSGLIALADSAAKRVIQVRFLARIIAGYKKAELSLRNIVDSGLLIQENNIDELQKIESQNEKIYLLIDLLLLVYLDGNIAERQIDYAVGFMAVLGIDRAKAMAIGNVVKGILEQNDTLILKQSEKIDITGVYCYMKNLPDGVLVHDLEKAKSVKADKIIFLGLTWEAIPRINIDEYKAEIVEFDHCTFHSILGLTCLSKKVVFMDCQFTDCEVEENLFILRNATINNTLFSGLKTRASQCRHLFYLYDCEVTDSKFINININHSNKNSYGGVLKCKNSVLKNLTFESIVTKGGGGLWDRHVLDIDGGRIMNCKFEKCILERTTKLIASTKETAMGQITVVDSNCTAEDTEYSNHYVDLSIDQVFEVK